MNTTEGFIYVLSVEEKDGYGGYTTDIIAVSFDIEKLKGDIDWEEPRENGYLVNGKHTIERIVIL